MKFILDDEQKLFADTLDKLLSASAMPGLIRSWADDSPEPGLELWRHLAEAGLFGLAVPEAHGGVGPLPVELVTAFRVLGRHGMPGPIVETVVVSELLGRLAGSPASAGPAGYPGSAGPAGGDRPWAEFAGEWLPRIADGTAVASLTLQPKMAYALDADVTDLLIAVFEGTIFRAEPEWAHSSLDPARFLYTVTWGDMIGPRGSGAVRSAAAAAEDLGILACAAQLSGLGDRLLEVTVEYAKTRQQFGRAIGEFQAVKHHLADAYVALEHARPLLYGAALSYDSPSFARDVSAAKAATSEATYFASRIALQVHGAIGYTDEYDPSLLIRKARALRAAWGSPSAHKARVLASLTE